MFKPADPISLGAFCFMAVILFCLYIWVMKKSKVSSGWIFGFIGVIVLASILAALGITAANPIPVAPVTIIGMLLFGVVFSFSKSGTKLNTQIPLFWLIGFQGFRFPLELILHHWADIGTIPKTMTWTGSNIDIVAGLLAIAFVPIVKVKPRLAWIPQIVGFGLLLNVLRVVVMSSPFPFSWGVQPPLLLGMYFPYVLIGPLFVVPALVGHILVFRQMKSSSPTCKE